MIVETSLAPGREILHGVARYLREHGTWSTFVEPRSLEDAPPAWLATWRGDGIIARVQSRQIADAVLAAGIPAVDVLGVVADPGLPLVHTDDTRISVLAAEHLLQRGFRHFAYVGVAGEVWSQRRRDAFATTVRPRAKSWSVFETTRAAVNRHHCDMAGLVAWVAALPKPAGLMVCSDQCGPAVLDACRRAGVSVPDEVAVIGVDDDETLCTVAAPGLSSVRPDHRQVGYEAAALLDRLMHGGDSCPSTGPVYVPPLGVATRRSTDVLALEDRTVAATVRMIRERACEPAGLTIDHLAAEVRVSRSVLQRRFQRALGRTLHDEMLRVRIARAKELLSETELPIALVAERAGFRHQEYMGAVFRQKLDTTPARFRRQYQHVTSPS